MISGIKREMAIRGEEVWLWTDYTVTMAKAACQLTVQQDLHSP
jgi:hypothetical protein